ncbi:MAG: FAD-dependent oxidoreductase [Lachnospiraceae bacterium]
MSQNNYPNLLSPGTIGSLTLRNKTVMCAMGINQSDQGFVNEAVINHYTERAKGGIGLIMVEVTCVDTPLGMNTANMLRIDDDKYIKDMSRLASSIHENGAKCLLQISHTGRGARRFVTGHQPVGPSAVAMPYSFMMGISNETPRALTIPEIIAIEDKYAAAALRAKKAGFDGIELHSVGFYLGQQFLSSTANIRTDEYGGCPENRVRFHKNILRKIRQNCGEDFTIAVKFSAVEMGEDAGITMEEGTYYASQFQEAGANAIEVLAGTWKAEADISDIPDTASPKGQAIGLCMAIKMGIQKITGKAPTVKLIGGGRAQDPNVAEQALATGQCDFIFIGKGVLSQPDLVNLIQDGRELEIRPCLGCGHCIDSQLQGGAPGSCSNNPVLGHGDNDYHIPPTAQKKKVFVVGAGVAGVEAARIAALRGHDVTLFEKENHIGGQIHYASSTPHKDNIKPLVPYLEHQLEIHHVKTHLGKEVTSEEIIQQKPDVVICATGVLPATLNLSGVERALQAKEVIDGAPTGDNIVLIGGGVVGCETAELLAKEGKHITIVEFLDKLAGKMVAVNRTILLGHLKALHVDILTSCSCQEITADSVLVKKEDGTTSTLPADTVVMAVGDHPNYHLYEELTGVIKELYNIGDSEKPDSIASSVSAGYYTALAL